MTRLVLIASWLLLVGFVAASNVENEAKANSQTSATADSDASSQATAEASSGDQDDSEGCDEPATTEAPATTSTEGPTLQCGDNEVYDDCPAECATDRCPRSEEESQASNDCPRPDKCPPPQCKCSFNYRRAENGTCIPTRDCPAFECSGENEEFYSCPPLCPSDDCSQASPSGRCPPQFGNILIVLECAPKCRCRKGYWRKNGACVPYDECNVPTCGDNEILNKCPASCASEYCPKSEEDANQSTAFCAQPDPCPPPACVCRFNHRRLENGTCVPTRSCPPFECSRPNEEFNACPPMCPSDDCGQATPDGTCPRRFGRIGILLICSPKCRCQKGYWRRDGVCVPYADCKTQCDGPHEEFTLEKQSCPPQECNSIVARIDCRNAPPPAPGCACKDGFMRLNSTSECIPFCHCPQMRSSPDCAGKTGVDESE